MRATGVRKSKASHRRARPVVRDARKTAAAAAKRQGASCVSQSPQIPDGEPLYCAMKLAEKSSASLDDILAKPGETFCDKLFNLIHEKNLDDVEVYKKANLDRKHFSKIRSNVKYKPTKKTALALAIALHLNMDETVDLLARAELALSPSNRGDLVVSYFIERGKYDIWEINNMLFKFGLPTLGV